MESLQRQDLKPSMGPLNTCIPPPPSAACKSYIPSATWCRFRADPVSACVLGGRRRRSHSEVRNWSEIDCWRARLAGPLDRLKCGGWRPNAQTKKK